MQATQDRITFQNHRSSALFPCLVLDLQLLPLGLGALFILWCEAPINASNHSQNKISKSQLQCSISLSIFGLVVAAPWAGYPFYFMVQSTSQCKQQNLETIYKILVWCTLSLSIFGLVAAAPWAGYSFYFMVQSTSQCEQPKLESISKSYLCCTISLAILGLAAAAPWAG